MTKQRVNLKEALLYERMDKENVKCHLCNFRCNISPGKLGICLVRKNIDGNLYSLNYNKVCAAGSDPIEKKPLFHFLPGSSSFSIACPGCNFKCNFCQNWQISQINSGIGLTGQPSSPEQIVQNAVDNGCRSISYTYTEPTIFFELADETARLAKKKGLKNVFVSNGYMTVDAIDRMTEWLDAINIDLKAFTEEYYKKLCKARLQPVLDNIEYIRKNTDIWMELTTLLVPGQNDSEQEIKNIAKFIRDKAGPDTPWHISRFYPNYKFDSAGPTPAEKLRQAYNIAKQEGLKHIYIGNLPGTDAENTMCPDCGKILIQRLGYQISDNKLKNGGCPECYTKISGFF